MKSMAKLLFASLCLTAGMLHAQLTRGQISGTVQDPTGAVAPGVDVTITNRDTGIKNAAASNSVGVYRFVAIEPGTYSVEFAKTGFETMRVTSVQVTATQEVTLNQTLQLAQAATTVEVIEAPPGVELNKSTPTMERKLEASFVGNIAATGALRDINQLALLTPTVARAPGSTTLTANGQRARNNNFLVDGVDNNDISVTVVNARVVPEGVEEFQTQIQTFSAEFGHSSGAQIQAITKSGTNAFHGEVFDYYRGNWMEPLNLINKRAGLTATPRFVHNQAGADAGGPVIKNRTFFFGLFEGDIRREAPDARNSSTANIPTQGGFAALANVPLAAGETQDARNRALSGLAFLNTIYPKVGSYSNLRTQTVNGVPIQVGTINIPLANPYEFYYYQARVDHKLSERDMLTYRMVLDKRLQPDVASNLQFGSLFSAAQANFGQDHALSETHTFGPRLISQSRFSFIRRNLLFPENDPVTPNTQIGGFFQIGGLSNYPQGRVQNIFEYQNTSTYFTGRHSIKFGVDVRRVRLYNIAGFDSKGTYAFDDFQGYMNNQPATFRQSLSTATFDARQTAQNYFVQDDIKVTKQFAVTLGVRYEAANVPFGGFGATDALSLGAGVPGPVQRDNNNWAPRLGLAYSPAGTSGLSKFLFGEGKTSFRGGYGMAYDILFYNLWTNTASNYPRVINNDIQDRTALANRWPNILPAPSGIAPPFDPRLAYVNALPDSQAPTTHFYNFSIQRQFARNVVFEIAYVGSRSYHGIRQGQLNPGILTPAQAQTVRASGNVNSIAGLPGVGSPSTPSRRLVPAWGARTTFENNSLSRYDGMYVRLDKRLSRGLEAGGNFTWSKTLSDNDDQLNTADISNWTSQVPQDYFNYRNEWSRSVFDVPYRVAFYLNYQVPWFQGGTLGSAAMKQVFGGWRMTGTTDWQSGQPFTVRTNVDTAGTGTTGPHRPTYNPSGSIQLDPVTGDYRTFTTPINGTGIFTTFLGSNGLPLANSQSLVGLTGNLGRNTFRGPGIALTNVAFHKEVGVTERFKADLRVDFINAFNHRNFFPPVATMNSPVFGQNTLKDPGGRTMLASVHFRF